MDTSPIPTDWETHVGEELRKSYRRYADEGFFRKYLSGRNILDIGYKGYVADATPIFPHAIGVDLDYPGYDGKRLPFPDESQDAVFSSHTLEHIPDYRQSLADWFRVLRIGGFLVLAVPHQFLYERKRSLPSRWNGDHRRFYTAAALLTEIEEAIDPFTFRVRHLEDNDRGFDYTIPPETHAVGSYEIVVVIERIRRPAYADAVMADEHPSRPPVMFTEQVPQDPRAAEPVIAIRSDDTAPSRIVVLKLDHRGDFIMARPAFAELRRQFPASHLTLLCGPWNRNEAESLGVFDEVLEFRFFHEGGPNTQQSPQEIAAQFAALLAGRRFDLAIDLRVDEDTRDLLAFIDAGQKAGFGRAHRFPFLDIAMPLINPTWEGRAARLLFGADRFVGRVGTHEGFSIGLHRRANLSPGELMIFGPYAKLDPGHYTFEIIIDPLGRSLDLGYDICTDLGQLVLDAGVLTVKDGQAPKIVFQSDQPARDLEFRLRAGGSGVVEPFRFRGIRATKAGVLQGPHQQELQSLLVHLVGLRMRNPFHVESLA